jgi:hypothetical protein
MVNANKIVVGIPEGEVPFVIHIPKREGNNKMDFRGVGCDGGDCIEVAYGRIQWRAFVNTMMNFRMP